MSVYLVCFETDDGAVWIGWSPKDDARDGYVECEGSIVWARNMHGLRKYVSDVRGVSVDDVVTTHRPDKLLNQVRSGIFDPEALLDVWNAFTDLDNRDSDDGKPFWYDVPNAKKQYEELFARSRGGEMVGAAVEAHLDREVIESVINRGVRLLEDRITNGCCVDSRTDGTKELSV